MDGLETPDVFIQWKGTDVCMDFRCTCGTEGHVDGYFAAALECPQCGSKWALSTSLDVSPLPSDWEGTDPLPIERPVFTFGDPLPEWDER